MNNHLSADPTSTRGTIWSTRRAFAARLLAGAGLTVATLAVAGGAAFAGAPDGGDDPITPIEFVPGGGITLPHGPIFTLPEPDDKPEIPDFQLPEIPDFEIPDLEIPEIPELPCIAWDPAQTATVHSDPVAGTVSVMISYSGNTAAACDTLFVIHSIQLDETMTPIGLLAEEHVSMDDLDDNGGSVTVTVPIDPCYARVFTDGPEAYVLADTTYGEGCPTETTEPTEPTEPTVPQPDPTTTSPVPAGQLPATGGSSTTIALIGGIFMATGLGLACAVRGSQVRSSRS